MNVFDFFMSYRLSQYEIAKLQGKIDAIESSLDAVTHYEDVKIQSSFDPIRREKLLAELADRKAEIKEAIGKAELQGLEVLNTISSIQDPMQSRVLMYEYIEGLTDNQIMAKYGIRAADYHFYAIESLQEILKEKEYKTS